MLELEELLGFPIKTIQVDNGAEFVNNRDITDKLSYFEEVARAKGYEVQRIKPYSPWQNGKVEQSHREDEKILYKNGAFHNLDELINAVKEHEEKDNSTAKLCLNFKSPNEVAKSNMEPPENMLKLRLFFSSPCYLCLGF